MSKKHIIIAVHGIRDFGQWQDRLGDMLVAVEPSVMTERYRFGYFSVLAFLVPFARWLVVTTFRRRFAQLIKANPDARFSIVAHSFGTHIVAHAIRGMKPSDIPRIETIILAASVLRSSFDWATVISRSRANGKGIKQVVNDCGWDDNVLILSQLFVLFTGMAGRVGFYGFIGADVKNRFFPGGHGHYFKPAAIDADAFMREWWLPILAAAAEPKDGLPFPRNTIRKGIFYTILRLAEPTKICAYALAFLLIWNIAYLEPRRAAAKESYRRQYGAAAIQMQSDRSIPEAFRTLLRLTYTQSDSPGDDDPAHVLARFAGQRLTPFDTVRSSLKTDTVYEWGDGTYLLRDQPIRVSVRRPIAEYHSADFHCFILVGEGRSVWLVDDQTGQVRWTTSIEEQGNDASHVRIWRLNDSEHFAIDFDVEQPEEDETPHHVVDVDLSRGVGNDFSGYPAASEGCASIEPRLEAPDDDDDLTAKELKARSAKINAQRARTTACLLPLQVEVPPPLRFPIVAPERDAWSFRASAPLSASDAAETGQCAYGELLFTHNRREDVDSLRFESSGVNSPQNDAVTFQDNGGCFFMFEGPHAKNYIAVSAVTGKSSVTWRVCELRTSVEVRRCVEDGFYYLAKGDLSMSPNRRYLALADDDSEGIGTSWSLIDLQKMTVLQPTVFPVTHVSAAAMTNDAVLVAAPAAAPFGALELWAYELTDGPPKFVARQLVPPPEGFSPAEDDNKRIHDATRLITNGGSFVMASVFQEITELQVSSDSGTPAWVATAIPWLVPPKAAPLITLWTKHEAGLPVNLPIAITYSPNKEVLALSAGSQIRLANTSDGTFLTPVVDISAFPDCSGPIVVVTVSDDLSLAVTTSTCVATRRPPLSAAVLAKMKGDPSLYFGSGTDLTPMLSGELRAP